MTIEFSYSSKEMGLGLIKMVFTLLFSISTSKTSWRLLFFPSAV
jgi:hypothetical protein